MSSLWAACRLARLSPLPSVSGSLKVPSSTSGLTYCGEGGEQRALARVGRPAVRGELRALEEALRALVDAVEQVAVDPLGVEQQDEGAAHARVRRTSAGAY